MAYHEPRPPFLLTLNPEFELKPHLLIQVPSHPLSLVTAPRCLPVSAQCVTQVTPIVLHCSNDSAYIIHSHHTALSTSSSSHHTGLSPSSHHTTLSTSSSSHHTALSLSFHHTGFSTHSHHTTYIVNLLLPSHWTLTPLPPHYIVNLPLLPSHCTHPHLPLHWTLYLLPSHWTVTCSLPLPPSGIVDSLLEGVNCSVFAYGATGAGKTHTMLGGQDHPGVIFLTMMELYRKIYERKEEISCDVAVSYLEVPDTCIHVCRQTP